MFPRVFEWIWGVCGSALRQDHQYFAPFSVRMELSLWLNTDWQGSSSLERNLGVLLGKNFWAVLGECHQKTEECDSSSLLSTGEKTPGGLVQFWASQYERDTHRVQPTQQRLLSLLCTRDRTFEKRGREWGQFSINSRRLVRMLRLPITTNRESLGKAEVGSSQRSTVEWQETINVSWKTKNSNFFKIFF